MIIITELLSNLHFLGDLSKSKQGISKKNRFEVAAIKLCCKLHSGDLFASYVTFQITTCSKTKISLRRIGNFEPKLIVAMTVKKVAL